MHLFSIAVCVVTLVAALWGLRALLKSALPRAAKVLAGALLLSVPALTALLIWGFGGLSADAAPRWMLLYFNFGLGFVVFFMFVAAVLDALGLMKRLAGRKGGVALGRRAAFGALAISGAAVAGGVAEGVRVPDVRERSLYLKALPAAFEGYRVVQLTDVHASPLFGRAHLEEVVARVNALKPDLIVITGDLVDGRAALRMSDVEAYRGLFAPDGVWACEGNHEHYADYEKWMAILPTFGIRWLQNASTPISRNGETLWLAGLRDRVAARFGRKMPNLSEALVGVPENARVLLLVHQPLESETWAQDARIAAQLSGHTHGGQIVGFDRIVALQNAGFVRGFYRTGPREDTTLFVHPGTGLWNGFAMRIGVPGEITLFTLTGREPDKTTH